MEKVEIKIIDEAGNVQLYVVNASLNQIVWDGILTSQYQDEQWHDEDTCKLIVKKLKGESPIEYAFGNIPGEKENIRYESHKGYFGEYSFNKEENIFFGKLVGIKDLVTFEGNTEKEAVLAFMVAVEDYIELKKELQ